MRIFLFAISMLVSGLALAEGTCTNTYPSFWQDPDSKFTEQWQGQIISNTPGSQSWQGATFQLSDAYPTRLRDERSDQPWRDARYDALFDPATDQPTKAILADEYAWLVMNYIQEGNTNSGSIDTDWTLCNNRVRAWYHMPFQTYDVMSGREFVHGLTREAPVTFSLKSDAGDIAPNSTVWAVGFYNATGAHTIGSIWKGNMQADVPESNISFAEGTVVGKLLFNTLSDTQLPILQNMPAWTANISDPAFCQCPRCTMHQQSLKCPRTLTTESSKVRLLQFDIAVKDSRAPGTQWVFGTFVADGQRKAGEPDPWQRISPLGLMWGNDTPPVGALARQYPADTRNLGFAEEVIFWDTVDMLNAVGGGQIAKSPGHLGCNNRLNGPADNANSACMSCHGTASRVDKNGRTPPIIAQFGGGRLTNECVVPTATNQNRGFDATGVESLVINGVSFSQLDRLYFANTGAGVPFNTTTDVGGRPFNVLPGMPDYDKDGPTNWISLDYSLQLSISLVQWQEWQNNKGEHLPTHDAVLPGR